jgi:hypothetical protein
MLEIPKKYSREIYSVAEFIASKSYLSSLWRFKNSFSISYLTPKIRRALFMSIAEGENGLLALNG